MAERFRADHHPSVRDDILALPNLELRKLALIRITQLVSGEIRGIPLDRDLVGAYKLYFPERHMLAQTERERREIAAAEQGGWRIVYRILDPLPGADRRHRLQVVAVGARAGSHVYNAASDRLRPARQAAPSALPAPRAPQAALPPPRPRLLLQEAQRAALERQNRYSLPRWR